MNLGKTIASGTDRTIVFAKKQFDPNSNENNNLENESSKGYLNVPSDWLTVRTSDGKVGYLKKGDGIVRINDGELKEVSELYDGTDFQHFERVVAVGVGNEKNNKLVIRCDENGIFRVGEISKEFLQNVDFSREAVKNNNENETIITSPDIIPDIQNEISVDMAVETKIIDPQMEELNRRVLNWQNDITSGVKGIDISWFNPGVLDQLMIANPDFKYAIVRMGGTQIVGENLKLVGTSVTISQEEKDLTLAQIEVLRKYNIPIATYFYATDSNPEEGIELANHIEQSIDELGGNITPIIDSELCLGGRDRAWYLEGNNFNRYLQEKNISSEEATNLQNSLDEIRAFHAVYIENNQIANNENLPKDQRDQASAKMTEYGIKMFNRALGDDSVMKYVEYCQDLKAQSISAAISKLHNDGYIKGNGTILYSGNQAISKDKILADVDGGWGTFQQIALFKYDDVKRYLTDPNSKYYISQDFDLRVWFADYTSSKNYSILGDASAMVQRHGNVDFNEEKYDLNYMCPEFYEYLLEGKLPTIEEIQNPDELSIKPDNIISASNVIDDEER